MTATTTTAEAEAYLSEVRAHLDDLSEEDRSDLLEDLAQHLEDISADADQDIPLAIRLGPPAQYAAELRSAAGLPPRAAEPAQDPIEVQSRSLNPLRVVTEAWNSSVIQHVRAFIPQLRPSWWVMRGYLVVAVPALWAPNAFDDFPFPSVGGSRLLGLVFILAAIVGSVMLGKVRLRIPGRLLVSAGNIVLAAMSVGLLMSSEPRISPTVHRVNVVSGPGYELESKFGPVTNIFPYAADGTPLANVLLYDQDGRPLRTERQLWWPERCNREVEFPLAADGVPVEFAYPKNYVLPRNLAPDFPGNVDAAGRPTRTPCPVEMPRPTVPIPVFPQPG